MSRNLDAEMVHMHMHIYAGAWGRYSILYVAALRKRWQEGDIPQLVTQPNLSFFISHWQLLGLGQEISGQVLSSPFPSSSGAAYTKKEGKRKRREERGSGERVGELAVSFRAHAVQKACKRITEMQGKHTHIRTGSCAQLVHVSTMIGKRREREKRREVEKKIMIIFFELLLCAVT